MISSEIEIPSNKKFGFFFTFVFALATAYYYDGTNFLWAFIFGSASLIFLVITIVRAEILLPLNKLWIKLGLLLGMIVSPFVLGIIFFGILTPVAFVIRISGRDELRLKFRKKKSHWILRSEPIKSESFKQQF